MNHLQSSITYYIKYIIVILFVILSKELGAVVVVPNIFQSANIYNVVSPDLDFTFTIDTNNTEQYLMFRVEVPNAFISSYSLSAYINSTQLIHTVNTTIIELDPPLQQGNYTIEFRSDPITPLVGILEIKYYLSVVSKSIFGSNGINITNITLPVPKFGLIVMDYVFPEENKYEGDPVNDIVSLFFSSSVLERVLIIVGRKGDASLEGLGIPGQDTCITQQSSIFGRGAPNTHCRSLRPYTADFEALGELAWNPCVDNSGIWEIRITSDRNFDESETIFISEMISPIGDSFASSPSPPLSITLSTNLVQGTVKHFRLPDIIEEPIAARVISSVTSPIGINASMAYNTFYGFLAIRNICGFKSGPFIRPLDIIVDNAVFSVGISDDDFIQFNELQAPSFTPGQDLIIWVIGDSSEPYASVTPVMFDFNITTFLYPTSCENETFTFIPAEYWQWIVEFSEEQDEYVCVATNKNEFPECLEAQREIYEYDNITNTVLCKKCSKGKKPDDTQSKCVNDDDDDSPFTLSLIVALSIVACLACSFMVILCIIVVIIIVNIGFNRLRRELQSDDEEDNILDDLAPPGEEDTDLYDDKGTSDSSEYIS